MTHTILANNFKKYRTAKNMTQEQVAEVLHVNTQTVSRWECGTTLPDALTLPVIAKLYGAEAAEGFTIQYGGSMNAKNAAELLSKVNVDGGLIGGASLKTADFTTIVNAAQ